MRLDKFLTHTGTLSRTEAAKAAKCGRITVDGKQVRDTATKIDPDKCAVAVDGIDIIYREHIWIMMNKPAGVVSATEDGRDRTVIDLLPEQLQGMGLFPCGRLDRDTVGLIMLTDDGELSHSLLSPKHHAEKVYSFTLSVPYDKSVPLETGILMDGKMTKPAVIEMEDELHGRITLTEGKYHQIKRMFERAGSTVTFLKRESFAGIPLDPNLAPGGWRSLTTEEENLLRSNDVAFGK
ncbi:MAG: rRNA pseudouridine synthase [Clostridia bacterium]|nr:rRNA pseudouridine synthase [Clostridia bacterium]